MTVTIDGGAGVTFPDGVQQTNGVTNTGGDPPYFAARAWGVFIGSTSTILSQSNVASVSRNGTGDYTVTFSTPMPNTNYAVVITARGTGTDAFICQVDGTTAPTVNAFRIQLVSVGWPAGSASSAAEDSSRVSFAVFA